LRVAVVAEEEVEEEVMRPEIAKDRLADSATDTGFQQKASVAGMMVSMDVDMDHQRSFAEVAELIVWAADTAADMTAVSPSGIARVAGNRT
jgi:hypothetical protein